MAKSNRPWAALLAAIAPYGCVWLLACSPESAAAPVAEGDRFAPGSTSTPSIARVQAQLASQLDRADAGGQLVDVIISFRVPSERFDGPRWQVYRRLQDDLLARHQIGSNVKRQFKHVPALAARISRDAFERLRADPNVEYIQLDGTGSGSLKEAVPAIGGDQVKKIHNLTGKGVRVGVLDTGVVTQHPDLSDAIVAQHCFTQLDCPPSRAAEGTSAEDDHGHGSNVAGIIASNGKVASAGFAPDVELVAVKINDSNNSGQVSDWVAGLDWVYENLATLKVKVINMSFGTNATYATEAQCDSEEAAMAAAIKNLVDAGVTLFAATGNSGYTDRLPSPACITGVIAVAATYDSDAGPQPSAGGNYMWQYGMGYANCSDQTTSLDKITCFSNTHPRVDLVAPGAPIISDGLNNGTSTYRGTSQASPAAAGVAALLLQCNPALTPAEVKKYLTTTGVKLTDPKNNLSFPSVRALKAVEAACYAGNSGASGAGAGGSSPTSGNTAGTSGKKTSAAGSGGSIKTGAGGQTGTNSAGGTVGVGGASVGVGGQPITTTVSTNAQPVTAGGAAGAVVPIVGSGTGMGASDGCGCSVLGSGRSPVPVSLAFLIFSIRVGRRLRRRRTG